MRLTLGYKQEDRCHVVMVSRSASLAEVVAKCEHVFGCANTVLEVAVGSRRAVVSDVEQLRDGDHLNLSTKKRNARALPRLRKRSSRVVYEESECSEEGGGSEAEDEGNEENDENEEENEDDESEGSEDSEKQSEEGSDVPAEEDSEREDSGSDSAHDDAEPQMPAVYSRIQPGANNGHTSGRRIDTYDRDF